MAQRRDKMKQDLPQTPIAVIGMAALFPQAPSLKAYWRLLRRGEDAVTEIPASHWNPDDYFAADPKAPDMTYCRRGAFLPVTAFDPSEFGIPPTALEATDTAQLLGLVAARDALADAGYADKAFDRAKTSVILGVTGTLELVIPLGARLGHPHWRKALAAAGVADDVAEDVVRRIADAYVPWQENSFPGLLGNVVAGRIANRLDLKGTNCVVDAACASAMSALHLAVLELAAGRSDMVVTGGVDTLNDIFMYMCFSKTQALSAGGDARPFAADADGTVLGEGVGMLVLKRLADAERDGDRIDAVIRGVGSASDGRYQSIYAPRVEGQMACLEKAYQVAGVDPGTITMVEAHGTGTRVGDVVEFEALQKVYRAARAAGTWCALGSVKSQIGHAKAAAGAASLIKTILALRHRVLPPTLKVTSPNPKLGLAHSPFYLNTEARPWLTPAGQPRRAAVSSFGFGGSNFHAVLEEYPQERTVPAWDGSVEIIALSAPDRAQLANALAAWRQAVADGLDEAHFAVRAAASRQAFANAHDCRLVLVVEKGDNILQLLDAARAELERSRATSWHLPGVHFGSGSEPGGLAVLFPGQASQYVGMGRDLTCVFPEAQAALAAADAAAGNELALAAKIFPPPTFDADRRRADELALTATQVAQPALGAVSLAGWKVLERFGIQPRWAAGHSFGELVALYAAGRIDEASLLALAVQRGQAMAASRGEPGTMAAVRAPLDELQALVTDRGLDVVLANRNTPDQGVLSGSKAAVQAAVEACTARGWRATPLNVSGAFHSPLMAEARARFAAALKKAEFAPGRIPVYANVSAAPHAPESAAVRESLAAQLVQPVRFVELIEALYAAGARTFVEVGPKAVLAGLVGTILRGRAHEVTALDASAGRRSGLVDLADVLARLAAAGHAVNLARWEIAKQAPKPAKMSVPLSGSNYRTPRLPLPPAAASPAPKVAPRAASGPRQENHVVNEQVNASHPPAASAPAGPAAPAPPGTLDGTVLAGMFQIVQEGLRAMQVLQQQTAAAHQRFLEGQELTQRVFQQVMDSQQRLFERVAGLPVSPAAALLPPLPVPQPMTMPAPAAPVYVPPPTAYVPPPAPFAPPAAPAPVVAQAPPPAAAISAPAPRPAPLAAAPAAPAADGPSLEDAILDVVAELTGYPREMVEPDMDMEADLGIDSIKRVEILAAVQAKRPDVGSVDSSHVGSLRTLRDILSALGGPQKEVAPSAPNPLAGPSLPAPAPAETTAPVEPAGMAPLGAGVSRADTPAAAESVVSEPVTPLARHVLRAVELPRTAPRPLSIAPGHEVWIVEDGTGLAGALVTRLVTQGIAARIVGTTRPVDGEACAPVGGLIHLFPPVDGPQEDTAEQLKGAFALTRELAADLRGAGREGGALFVTVSRLDGAFGLSGPEFDPLQGALAGLTKTAAHEWPEVRCRAFDVEPAWMDAPSLAERLLAEIAADGPIEIGLSPTHRRGLDLLEEPANPGRFPLTKGDVVLVSGGARGVTADTVQALAARCQPTLVLLGRSPEPGPEPVWARGVDGEAALKRAILGHVFGRGSKPTPSELEAAYRRHMAAREVAANLARLRATGATVMYRALDVTEPAAVAALVAEVRDSHGPIRGIVHGAGVIEDRKIEDKDDAAFARVFDTKVAGALALLEAVGADELRVLAFFSSVSGRFGRQGQVDYAMANEALNKLARHEARRRPQCHVVSLNWGPWDGGMVTPALQREFARIGVPLIARPAGAAAFVAELAASPAATEVVLGGFFQHKDQAAGEATPPAAAPLDDLEFAQAFLRKIDVATHPVLDAHRLAGRPVVPLALMMEWLGHAALHEYPGFVLRGLDDVRVLRGIALEEPAGQVEAVAAPRRRREGTSEVVVELRTRGADGRVQHAARARAVLGNQLAEAPEAAWSELADGQAYPLDVAGMYREVLFHGAALHAVQAVRQVSPGGLDAVLATAPAPAAWMKDPLRSAWLSDPLVLDGVFQLGILWSHAIAGAPSLPSGVARYRPYVAAWPREAVRAQLRTRGRTGASVTADVALHDGAGRLLAVLEGCTWTIDASLAAAFAAGRVRSARRPG